MKGRIKGLKIAGLLFATYVCVLAVFMFGQVITHAADIGKEDVAYGMGEPDKGQMHDDPVDNSISIIKKSARNSNNTVRRGIDVSHWQGDIDWNAVRASGVEFVFVKVGGRDSDGDLYEDAYFRKNLAGANAAGLRTGVYFYSEAITEAEAIEEADYICGRIYNYNITMPVVLDYEFCGNGKACRLRDAWQDVVTRTSVCSAFCQRVQKYGYTPCIYANKTTLKNTLDGEALAKYYKIWVAQYYYLPGGADGEYYHDYPWRNTNYEGTYDFWQFSSQGYINGIAGYVDLDYWFDDGTIYGADYSAIFDAEYYAEHNQDVVQAMGNQPSNLLQHFLTFGMKEGRQACAEFNPVSYRNEYPDLRRIYGNDWAAYYNHYKTFGKAEGRHGTGCEFKMLGAQTVYNGIDYAAVYDMNYYYEHYNDLARAIGYDENALLSHFVNYGMREGRQACGSFNVKSYKNYYADLRSAYGNNLPAYYLHYINYGKNERRIAVGYENKLINSVTVNNGVNYAAVYDYNYYISHNPDVKRAFGEDDIAVLSHFVNYGMKEGRQAKADFNVTAYRNTYSDLRRAYDSDLQAYYLHYINFGCKEGRIATRNLDRVVGATTVYKGVDYSAVYDFNEYISRYSDLRKAFGYNEKAVLEHFVNYGMKEGRQAKTSFNVHVYKNKYRDLQNAYGEELEPYYLHYINFGINEGRVGQ